MVDNLNYLFIFSFESTDIYTGNKIFCDKIRLKQYIYTNPAIQKVIEGKPQPKEAHFTHKKKSSN